MSPSVSVVIPAYNVERYIGQCLQSVLAQTGVDCEIILIDDGSTDGTLAIAHDLLRDSRHGKVIALPENGGQARARNVGLDEARGDFVALLDSDDFYLRDSALADWLRSARDLGGDLVRCGFTRVTAAGGHSSDGPNLGIEEQRAFASVETYPRLVNITSSWQFLFNRSFLAANGIRFSPRLRQREDRLFFTEALLKARRVGVSPERLIAHRIHPASTMHNVSLEQLRLFAIHIEELNRLMRQIAVAEYPVFLRENLAFYYAAALGYWRPLIKLGASGKATEPPGEVKAFIDALGEADWAAGALSEIQYLDLTEYKEERFKEGDVDLLRALAKQRQYRLFCDVVAGRRLRPDEMLRLAKETRDGIEQAVCRHMSFTRETSFRAALGERKPGLAKKPAVILHCGMPKTGTSALQAYLETNRLRLLDQGVYYPLSGLERGQRDRRDRTAGHAYLFDCVLNGGEPVFDELVAELAMLDGRITTVVLSCENIVSHRFWGGAGTLRKIAAAFAGFQVTPVVFFRSQSDWLESMYAELLSNPNTGMALDPEAFVGWQESVGFLDYDSVSKAFEDIFGGACRFLAYSGSNGDDTVRAFFEAAGIARPMLDAPVHNERRNVSASADMALLARLLKERGVAPRTRARVLATAARLDPSLVSQPARLVPRRILEAVVARHAEGNARVEERYLEAGALAPEGTIDRPLATLDGIAIPAPVLLAALKPPRWPFSEMRRLAPAWAQSNNRLVTFVRAWAHPVQTARKMPVDADPSRSRYGRRVLFLLLRVYVTLRSRRTAIARFDRNPRAFLRDSGDAFLRASGRRLFR